MDLERQIKTTRSCPVNGDDPGVPSPHSGMTRPDFGTASPARARSAQPCRLPRRARRPARSAGSASAQTVIWQATLTAEEYLRYGWNHRTGYSQFTSQGARSVTPISCTARPTTIDTIVRRHSDGLFQIGFRGAARSLCPLAVSYGSCKPATANMPSKTWTSYGPSPAFTAWPSPPNWQDGQAVTLKIFTPGVPPSAVRNLTARAWKPTGARRVGSPRDSRRTRRVPPLLRVPAERRQRPVERVDRVAGPNATDHRVHAQRARQRHRVQLPRAPDQHEAPRGTRRRNRQRDAGCTLPAEPHPLGHQTRGQGDAGHPQRPRRPVPREADVHAALERKPGEPGAAARGQPHHHGAPGGADPGHGAAQGRGGRGRRRTRSTTPKSNTRSWRDRVAPKS